MERLFFLGGGGSSFSVRRVFDAERRGSESTSGQVTLWREVKPSFFNQTNINLSAPEPTEAGISLCYP